MLADAAFALRDNFTRTAPRDVRPAGDMSVAMPDGVFRAPIPRPRPHRRVLRRRLDAGQGRFRCRASDRREAPIDSEQTDRFIVRLRDPSADPRPRLAALGGRFGERLEHLRAMSGGAHVVRLARRMMRAEARETARLLRSDPDLLSIEPDLVLRPMAVPNDPYFAQQWHYHEAAAASTCPRRGTSRPGRTASRSR
jgi:hypothetical protein